MGDLPFFCSHPERKVSLEAANLPIIESRALVFFFTLTACLEGGKLEYRVRSLGFDIAINNVVCACTYKHLAVSPIDMDNLHFNALHWATLWLMRFAFVWQLFECVYEWKKPDLRPTRNCSRRLSTPVMHVGLNLIFIAIVTI